MRRQDTQLVAGVVDDADLIDAYPMVDTDFLFSLDNKTTLLCSLLNFLDQFRHKRLNRLGS